MIIWVTKYSANKMIDKLYKDHDSDIPAEIMRIVQAAAPIG